MGDSKRKKTFDDIILNKDELYSLLVSAGRYAYGRSTYVVEQTVEIVKRLSHHLNSGELTVILRDVEEALAERSKRIFGNHKCDLNSLLELQTFLKNKIDNP